MADEVSYWLEYHQASNRAAKGWVPREVHLQATGKASAERAAWRMLRGMEGVTSPVLVERMPIDMADPPKQIPVHNMPSGRPCGFSRTLVTRLYSGSCLHDCPGSEPVPMFD